MPRQTQTQWRRRNTYYEHRARMLLLQAYFMDGNDYNLKSNAQFLVDMWRRYVIIRMCVLCGADAVVQLWQFSMLKHSNASALTVRTAITNSTTHVCVCECRQPWLRVGKQKEANDKFYLP